MPEGTEAERRKDIRRTWRRIERGGGDALDTSLDFGRLALHAYMEERERMKIGGLQADTSADLTSLATAAALQKLAYVQQVAAEQQRVGQLLQFAALEGLGIPVVLRQQAAQAAADALGISPPAETAEDFEPAPNLD